MKYDVPDNYEFAKEYINSIAVEGYIPSDALIDEISMLKQFLISDFAKSHAHFWLLSRFPSLFIAEVLPKLPPKIELSEVTFEGLETSQSENIILCTEQRALDSFLDKKFHEFIKQHKGKILFLRRQRDVVDRVMKVSGKYIDGIGYNSWKSDCTSHLHMGLITRYEDEYAVEHW